MRTDRILQAKLLILARPILERMLDYCSVEGHINHQVIADRWRTPVRILRAMAIEARGGPYRLDS